ncbi:unnamed protein product [Phytomonas sp. Hart1]|nr:unnamed protein product [Phytomonas sp. Hart1]|eukprot:CCW69341.1 unnamed protein product [Phytomonas sp. isolate Hart1]
MSELPEAVFSDNNNNDLKSVIQEDGIIETGIELNEDIIFHGETSSGNEFEDPKLENDELEDQTIKLHFDAEDGDVQLDHSSFLTLPANFNEDDDEMREEAEVLNLMRVEKPDNNGPNMSNNLDSELRESIESRRERHRRRKVEKQRLRQAKESDKHSKKRKRDHSESDADTDPDDAPSRQRFHKGKRQTILDQYPREADPPPRPSAPPKNHDEDEDVNYFRRQLLSQRGPISDAALQQCVAELQAVIAACQQDDAYAHREAAVLDLLRPLTTCDLSFPQLRASRAGVAVGQLLTPRAPPRVRTLAGAILRFWFSQLPPALQQGLAGGAEKGTRSVASPHPKDNPSVTDNANLQEDATGEKRFDEAVEAGSPLSPRGSISGQGEIQSPLGLSLTGAITTLYSCPNCGAREAVRSTYSVQAHDSFPCILRCQGCRHIWNIET